MPMIRVFSSKKKTPKKLKIFEIRNSQHSAHGSVITGYEFIMGKIKQNEFFFPKLNVGQS